MALTVNRAREKSIEVITAGLQSGSIKLSGTSGGATPKAAAQNDVLYLTTLLEGLTQAMLDKDE